MKDHTKIFWFMTFHTKLCFMQDHYLLGLTSMDYLEIMIISITWS